MYIGYCHCCLSDISIVDGFVKVASQIGVAYVYAKGILDGRLAWVEEMAVVVICFYVLILSIAKFYFYRFPFVSDIRLVGIDYFSTPG